MVVPHRMDVINDTSSYNLSDNNFLIWFISVMTGKIQPSQQISLPAGGGEDAQQCPCLGKGFSNLSTVVY